MVPVCRAPDGFQVFVDERAFAAEAVCVVVFSAAASVAVVVLGVVAPPGDLVPATVDGAAVVEAVARVVVVSQPTSETAAAQEIARKKVFAISTIIP